MLPDVSQIVLVGDHKKQKTKTKSGVRILGFNNDDKAQIFKYLRQLIILQSGLRSYGGGTSFAIGYLDDGEWIQFFQLARISTTCWKKRETRILQLDGQGGEILIACLTGKCENLGYMYPESELNSWKDSGVRADRVLGFGSHGAVYRAKVSTSSRYYSSTMCSEHLVIKSFFDDSHFNREKKNLLHIAKRQLDEISSFVFPQVLGHTESSLLLSPLGAHFACTAETLKRGFTNHLNGRNVEKDILVSSKGYCILICALKAVHAAGLVHRDIKLSNFFPVFPARSKVR